MKRLLLSSLLLITFACWLPASSFTIGKDTIEIPAPTGFVKGSDQFCSQTGLAAFSDEFSEPLCVFISQSDALSSALGLGVQMDSYQTVSMLIAYRDRVVSMRQFTSMKQQFAREADLSPADNELFAKAAQVASEKISQATGADFSVETSLTEKTRKVFETRSAIGIGMYVNASATTDGRDENRSMYSVTMLANVAGKVIELCTYGPAEESRKLKEDSLNWVSEIVAANPPAPEGTSISGFWAGFLKATFIGAAIGIAYFLWTQKQKRARSA